jgi:EmrB/QacA subfamily drug resistance transporter
MNMTIILISLPSILRGLDVNPGDPSNFPYLLWTIMGYMLVTAVILVTLGKLSDIYGRVKLYKFGFLVFTIGSIMCAFSQNILQLIAFRMFQAFGGAFLFSNSAAIITDAFKPHERGKALGVNQISFLAGQFLGLILGGLLSPLGWRWLFWISVPVGIIGTIWAHVNMKEIGVINRNQKIDYVGNLTFGVGLTLILLGFTYALVPYRSSAMGWANSLVQLSIFLGIVLLILFIFIERKVAYPMFKLDLFKIRGFWVGNSTLFISALSREGFMFILVIWLQGIWLPLHGFSIEQAPFWAGLYMLPLTIGFMLMGPLSGYLSDKYGPRRFTITGMFIVGLSFIWLSTMPYNVAYWLLAAAIFFQGVGAGMFASPNISMIMSSVSPDKRGVASGMRATMQNVAQSMSMTVYFSILITALGVKFIGTSLSHVPPASALFSVFLGISPPGVDFKTFSAVFAPIFMSSLGLLFFISASLSILAAVLSIMGENKALKKTSSQK